MIVAIAIDKNNLKASINTHFGRCEWFCLFNSETKECHFIQNPLCSQETNAGCDAAQFLIEKRIEMAVAGRFGSKVMDLFTKNNIQMVIPELPKTLTEIINQFK